MGWTGENIFFHDSLLSLQNLQDKRCGFSEPSEEKRHFSTFPMPWEQNPMVGQPAAAPAPWRHRRSPRGWLPPTLLRLGRGVRGGAVGSGTTASLLRHRLPWGVCAKYQALRARGCRGSTGHRLCPEVLPQGSPSVPTNQLEQPP